MVCTDSTNAPAMTLAVVSICHGRAPWAASASPMDAASIGWCLARAGLRDVALVQWATDVDGGDAAMEAQRKQSSTSQRKNPALDKLASGKNSVYEQYQLNNYNQPQKVHLQTMKAYHYALQKQSCSGL